MKHVTTLLFLLLTLHARAADLQSLVTTAPTPNNVILVDAKTVADVYTDPADFKLAGIAGDLLCQDIERVTGRKPVLRHDAAQLGANAVIVGTLGHCAVIDKLVADGKLDVREVTGQWETYKIAVVDHPAANVQSAVVIVGSDRRATAYGVFDLSQAMGVSPWYWWADVPPAHHDALYFSRGDVKEGPPSVRYRGIFINDEDWGMTPWAGKTFDPKQGNIGPKTYAKVFELILRLRGNYLWPAMHPVSTEFGRIAENISLADDWGIVMGASHTEAMNRDNVLWPEEGTGAWRYDTNHDNVLAYWETWAKLRGPYEAVWTLGIRGVHDAAMLGPPGVPDRIKIVEQAITDQRVLLQKYVNADLSKVPQLFCPYKEVLPLYQAGLKVPDDVTMLWVDDNFGYIRQLSTPAEQKRAGAAGVYYHISYLGNPRSYTWVNSTPPALIWEEMTKAYAYGANRIWVVNVGDIKPGEIGMDFWMRLGWNVHAYDARSINDFYGDWAARQFGAAPAPAIAAVLREYFRLGFARRPESMDIDAYSTLNFQEAEHRLEEYQSLVAQAQAISDKLPATQRDSYYELVLYPAQAAALTSEVFVDAAYARLNAAEGRASAADAVARMNDAMKRLTAETAYFNNTLAGGKWKNMMTQGGTSNPTFAFKWPKAPAALPAAAARMGVHVEGAGADPATPANPRLPAFSRAGEQRHSIDLFAMDGGTYKWSAAASKPWIILSESSGTLASDHRLWVSIDWSKAPAGASLAHPNITGDITITGTPIPLVIAVSAANPPGAPRELAGFLEAQGVVSMNAEHFTRSTPREGAQWQVIAGLGRTGDSVAVFPTTVPSIPQIEQLAMHSPELDYDFTASFAGKVQVTLFAIPTHRIHAGRGLRCAVALDDEVPRLVDLDQPENSKTWQENVIRNVAVVAGDHTIAAAGKHTLKVFMVDPGVVLEKIVVSDMPLKTSELGPPETWFKPE